jgi:hypothetical protein
MLQITHENFFSQHKYVIIVLYILEQPSLGAPHEYVLHGLNQGLNWGFSCSVLWAFFLFVLAHSVSCCLLQRLKFHAHPSLLVGQLNTDIQVNNTAMPHLMYTHTHISTSYSCYCSFSSLHFFHFLGQAGLLRLFPSDTLMYFSCVYSDLNCRLRQHGWTCIRGGNPLTCSKFCIKKQGSYASSVLYILFFVCFVCFVTVQRADGYTYL